MTAIPIGSTSPIPIGSFRFTRHARIRCDERAISKTEVEAVLARPTFIRRGGDGTTLYAGVSIGARYRWVVVVTQTASCGATPLVTAWTSGRRSRSVYPMSAPRRGRPHAHAERRRARQLESLARRGIDV